MTNDDSPSTSATTHLDEVLTELKGARGLDLTGYRRGMLERRLAARMAKLRVIDSAAYLTRLRTDASECDSLIDTIAINVSSFFRNPAAFEVIAQQVLPEILERNWSMGRSEIRVWCAGCAAGEEAYSIAILIHEAVKNRPQPWRVHIFATDIDGDALQAAAAGVYPRESFATTKLGLLDKYFIPRNTSFEVCPDIKKLVRYSRHDLTALGTAAPPDSVYGSFDLVLCRNVLIYLGRELQNRVLHKIHRSLVADGYLVLGESGSLSDKIGPKFKVVDLRNRIFMKR